MSDLLQYKAQLLDLVAEYDRKYVLSKNIDPYTYDPGKTENLEYYFGKFDIDNSLITICTEIKGLRYENRSRNLDEICEGDTITVRRDSGNPFNSNNYEIFSEKNKSLGYLSANLCNRLAPLDDLGYVDIIDAHVHHIERFEDRSRYVKQGLLFIKMSIKIIGI